MPVKSLEDVVKTLSADEQQLLDKTFKAHPELKDGWLRQDEFSRKQNELQAKQGEFDTLSQYKEKMEPWAETTYERLQRLEEAGVLDKETGEELWTAKEAKFNKDLEEARKAAVAGGDMTQEQLDATVKQIIKDSGVVLTKEEIQALYVSQAKAMVETTFDEKYKAAETNFNTKTIPIVSGISTAMAVAAMRYEKETGKEFTDEDHAKVIGMLGEKNNYDPRVAMREYMKPFVDEKTSEAEIERRATEKFEQMKKDRGEMPGGGRETYIPPPDQQGNVLKMLERSKDEAGDFESKIMAGAVTAAKELRTEAK